MEMTLKDKQSVASYRASKHEQDNPYGIVVVLIEPKQDKEDALEYLARLDTAKYLSKNYGKITFIVGDSAGAAYMDEEALDHVRVKDIVRETIDYLFEEDWYTFYVVCRADRVQKNVIPFIKEEYLPTVLTVDTGMHSYDYVGDMNE